MHYEKPTLDFISQLRHGKSVTLFDRSTKYFHHFQLNKKEDRRICWQRHVSLDRHNWIEWNWSLSLKEVLDCRAEIAVKNQAMCFKG